MSAGLILYFLILYVFIFDVITFLYYSLSYTSDDTIWGSTLFGTLSTNIIISFCFEKMVVLLVMLHLHLEYCCK